MRVLGKHGEIIDGTPWKAQLNVHRQPADVGTGGPDPPGQVLLLWAPTFPELSEDTFEGLA